jgi:hypothetical protein
MPMYIFTVECRARGDTPEEAWEDACATILAQWDEFADTEELPEWRVDPDEP